jgi:hypothetical protein
MLAHLAWQQELPAILEATKTFTTQKWQHRSHVQRKEVGVLGSGCSKQEAAPTAPSVGNYARLGDMHIKELSATRAYDTASTKPHLDSWQKE